MDALRGLPERNRRVECTSALYEAAWSEGDSHPAVQQADRRRAAVEYASLDADDVAGAIRPHRETRIGEDRAVRDGCDIGSPLHVNLFAGGNAHAIKARPNSLDVEPFKFLDRFT